MFISILSGAKSRRGSLSGLYDNDLPPKSAGTPKQNEAPTFTCGNEALGQSNEYNKDFQHDEYMRTKNGTLEISLRGQIFEVTYFLKFIRNSTLKIRMFSIIFEKKNKEIIFIIYWVGFG